MKLRKSESWVLWYETVGFGLIILLTWLDGLADLSSLVFGGAPHINQRRGNALLTVLILLVWGVVFILTKRLIAHVHYLKGFLRVCAWCRKIGYDGKWIRLEEYFEQGFHVETTHGMCPECLQKMEEETAEFRRKEAEAVTVSTQR
jgi:hypothetical protein